MLRTTARLGFALTAVVGLSACASGAGKAVPTTTLPPATTTSTALTTFPPSTTTIPLVQSEATKYLAAYTPYSQAVAAFERDPTPMSNAQLEADDATLIAATTTFDTALSRIGLVGQAGVDAGALVRADEAIISILQGLSYVNAVAEEPTVLRDVGVANNDDNILRASLGLFPVT